MELHRRYASLNTFHMCCETSTTSCSRDGGSHGGSPTASDDVGTAIKGYVHDARRGRYEDPK